MRRPNLEPIRPIGLGSETLRRIIVVLAVVGLVVGTAGCEEDSSGVTANETQYEAAAGTLTEVRFSDASIVAVGGIGGSPAAVALTEGGAVVLRIMAASGRWEEHSMEAWQPFEYLAGFGSDGDAFAIVLGNTNADDAFKIRSTTDGTTWTTHGFIASSASQAFGDPSADRSTHVKDVSVDGSRVTVLIGTDPVVDSMALESTTAALGREEADQAIDRVLSWGPTGIAVRFSNGTEAEFTLADLGIDPSWVHPAFEVWLTQPDGSTRGIPVDGAAFIPLQPTDWTPVSATSALDELYVGGFRPDGVAVLAMSDLSTGSVESFNEVNLGDFIDESMAPLRAVMALRTTGPVPVAGISGQETGIALRLYDAVTAWNVPGASELSVAEIAVRGDTVVTVGYPGVAVTRSDFTSIGTTTASLAGDFGVADRHPTHISLTDHGLMALPQAGDDPSSFGSDGSAWLIVLAGPTNQPQAAAGRIDGQL
jgi:hypothetical protein